MKFISIYLLHNSIPGSNSTPQAAKKPKPSQSKTSIEIEPHLKDVDIKSKNAEPEPSGSGSGGPGGSHAVIPGRQPIFVLQLKIICIRKYFFKQSKMY